MIIAAIGHKAYFYACNGGPTYEIANNFSTVFLLLIFLFLVFRICFFSE